MNENYLECNKCGEKISGKEIIDSMKTRIKESPYISYGDCEFCGGKWMLKGYIKAANTRLEKAKKLNCQECIDLASSDGCGGKITCDIHWDGGNLENWNA